MNKLLFLGKGVLLLCLFATHFVQAQTVNTSYATQINSTFANLDKTKIPHKLLVDYAMEFEELSAYNGTLTNENLVNVGNFTGIYNTLLMARVQSNVAGLVNPITFKTNWNNLRQANKIVLSGLYYKYNEFKPDAPNNTITITNGKLYDKYINGVWQNPYNEKQVFAVSAPASARVTLVNTKNKKIPSSNSGFTILKPDKVCIKFISNSLNFVLKSQFLLKRRLLFCVRWQLLVLVRRLRISR